jgi:hypothetical protein
MRFAYMDETGNTGRRFDDADQPIHMILSLIVDETRVADLHEHMREVGRQHCPDDCDGSEFEFHGGDLFSGSGPFDGRSPTERIEIFDDILRGIEMVDAEVIVRGVHKSGLNRRYAHPYHPHDVALMFTIESIERMARECDCQVLLVADEAKEVEDAALRDLVNYQELGTQWGWRTEKIERIIDTIHFVPSHRTARSSSPTAPPTSPPGSARWKTGRSIAGARPPRSRLSGKSASPHSSGSTKSGSRDENKRDPVAGIPL